MSKRALKPREKLLQLLQWWGRGSLQHRLSRTGQGLVASMVSAEGGHAEEPICTKRAECDKRKHRVPRAPQRLQGLFLKKKDN